MTNLRELMASLGHAELLRPSYTFTWLPTYGNLLQKQFAIISRFSEIFPKISVFSRDSYGKIKVRSHGFNNCDRLSNLTQIGFKFSAPVTLKSDG